MVPNGQTRELEKDETILGILVPKGTVCIFPQIVVHRSKAIWGPDADKFNPERTWHSEAFFPFGVSPRDCLGRNIAMLEIRVTISNLFHAYTTRLVDPQATVEEFAGSTMYPSGGVNIFLEKRDQPNSSR